MGSYAPHVMGGLFQLARPLNCVMSAVGVGIGGMVAVGAEAWAASALRLAFAGIAAASFTAAGNALNDYADRETDRTNHPERPLPSGRVTPRAALAFATAGFAVAALTGLLASWECLVLVGVNAAVMGAYESRLKARGAVGNLAIGYLVGSLFLFAGLAVYAGRGDPLLRTAILAALAGLSTLGREVTKDIEDMAGDVDRRTLPQQIGARRAGLVATSAFTAAVVLSVVPWSLQILGFPYAALVVPADGMFIYAALYSAARPTASQRVAKYGMIVALVAFLAGGVG